MPFDSTTTPQHEGPLGGLTPLDPSRNLEVEKRDQQKKFEIDGELAEFFHNMWKKCADLNSAEWLAIKRSMVKCRYYFDSKQYGEVNEQCQWVDDDKRVGEVNYVDNEYYKGIQTCLMELERTKVQLSFSHKAPDSRYGKQIAGIAEARYNAHRKRLFNVIETQQENLSALLNGIGLRYTYFNWSKSTQNIPKVGQNPVGGRGQSEVCAVCSAPRRDETCKTCGSTNFKQIQSPQINMPGVQGYDSMPQGENAWVSPDPLGILFYLHAKKITESPYIIWKQVVLTEVLQSKYPDIPLGKGGILSTDLRYQSTYETSAPHSASYGSDSKDSDRQGSETEFEQGWFDPPLYQHKVLTKDCRLRNGKVIKAGTKLGDAFPKGLFLAKNGKIWLDAWSEDKNDKWTAAPYVMRPGTLIGAGTSVSLNNQDRKNDIVNLKMASIFQDSFRKEFVDPLYLDPSTIPNDPTERAVLTGSMPTGARIRGNAIDTLEPSQLSSEVYAEEEKIEASIQNQLGAFSTGGAGMPDIAQAAKNTATGFLALREVAVGRFAPALAVKADALDKEQAYQFLLNDQRFLTPEQWERDKGDYGEQGVKAFLSCNLREELIIEVSGESFMPVSSSQEKANMMGFSQFVAETQMPLDTEQAQYAAERFQIPKTIVSFGAQYDTAQGIIAVFKEIADEIVQVHGDAPTFDLNDPQILQVSQMIAMESGTAIDAQMDDHQAMMDSYKDWWSTDEGRSASNILKATVRFRYQEHREASAAAHAEDRELAMKANEPVERKQAEMATAQAESEAANNEATQQAEGEKMAVEAKEKQADREFQAGTQIAGHLNAEAERQNKLELEKMKQKKETKKAA